MRLLLCEDEKTLSRVIALLLEKNNYIVDCVYNGLEAIEYIKTDVYDAIILDVMMPKLDGFSVLKEIRNLNYNTPVIMLTAKSNLDDKLQGFELGVDDYLVKPFASSELLARIKAIIRRKEAVKNSYLIFNDLKLNTETFKIICNDKEESLLKKEYQILEILMSNSNKIVSLNQILNHIYSFDDGDVTTIWVYISYIRKKLKKIDANVNIRAIRNAGYILEAK